MTSAQHFAEIAMSAVRDNPTSLAVIVIGMTTLYILIGLVTGAATNYIMSESDTRHSADEIDAVSLISGVLWPIWILMQFSLGMHFFIREFGRSLKIAYRLYRPVARLPRATLRRKS